MIAFMTAVSPALANWQFTSWGMTLGQVKMAASANVTEIDPLTRNSVNGDRILLEGVYSTGTFNFTADYAFDASTHLDRVHLVLQSGDALALRTALNKKYGDPKHVDSDFDAFGGRITWITPEETIVLQQMSGYSPGVTPNVTLDYSRPSSLPEEGL